MHASSQYSVLDPPRIRPSRSHQRWRGEEATSNAPVAELVNNSAAWEETPKILRSSASNGMNAKAVLTNLLSRAKQHVRDAPGWLISLIIHLVVLLSLALISTSTGAVESILLTIQQSNDEPTAEWVEFSITPVELEDFPVEDSIVEVDVDLDVQPIQFESPLKLASIAMVPESFFSTDSQRLKKLPAAPSRMFVGRTSAMKERLIREAGGTEATENAVALGLEWLKRNQRNNGSWSLRGPYDSGGRAENDIAATAMAMLAFMGAGSTHHGGDYQKELLKAVRWLVKQQDREGFMAARCHGHEKMYAQAQAMIALCELYAMTGDSWIRPYAQASCDFACRAQSPQGGWRYQPRFDSDTSVTGWFVMGLKSGEAGGLEITPNVFQRVSGFLDTVSGSRENDYYGAVGYSYMTGRPTTPSMTAEGLLCRQYTGWHRNTPGMRNGLDAIVQNHPINMRERDVYYWYYATQALHHFGGPMWTRWNDQMKVALPAAQEKRGKEKGSWSPVGDAWGTHAGRLYTTCLSLYCLEVYYRHMPIYSPEEMDEA